MFSHKALFKHLTARSRKNFSCRLDVNSSINHRMFLMSQFLVAEEILLMSDQPVKMILLSAETKKCSKSIIMLNIVHLSVNVMFE